MTRLIRTKRGVSVVISTLLVLAITIVGAMSVSNLMSNSLLTTVNDTPKNIIMANSMLLVGYDTRDGDNLSNVANFENKFDNRLCTVSCAGASSTALPNDTPGGTEFIVLQLWNKNSIDITIRNVQVNGIIHTWDLQTRNQPFDGLGTHPDYPEAGKFSIIHHSNAGTLIQNGTDTMTGDIEKRIIIKLSPDVIGHLPSQDIGLGEPLQILVKISDELPAEYVILSGDTK